MFRLLLSNPWFWLAVVAGAVALFGTGVYYGREYQLGRQAQDKVLIADAVTAMDLRTAKNIAAIEAKAPVIRERVTHEITHEKVYTECHNTQAMMDAINEARTGKVKQ